MSIVVDGMHAYIAYRNLKDYFQNNGFGGTPVNNDYRLNIVEDGTCYLLTKDHLN